jgi:hypothetical protein
VNTIYPYLEEIAGLLRAPGQEFPLLVDCLNCEKGCNGGPGTGNWDRPLDTLEGPVLKRAREMEAYYAPARSMGGFWGDRARNKARRKLDMTIRQYWKKGLYKRTYRDLSGNNNLREPSDAELQEVYRRMRKFSAQDIYDCTTCGYGSCKAMAAAIFNRLNKPENCHHYALALIKEGEGVGLLLDTLKSNIGEVLGLIEGIDSTVQELKDKVGSQTAAALESAEAAEKMVGDIRSTSELSLQKQDSIQMLHENAEKGQQSMQETIQAVKGIAESMDGIASAIKIISAIAANTNLLSMNAAIEAAHAGDAGRGFAVVAGEIRRLSENTSANSRNISQTLSKTIEGITVTSKRSADTGGLINSMSQEIRGFAGTMTELISALSGLSAGSGEIVRTLASLREMSGAVKTSYREIHAMIGHLRGVIQDLARLSSAHK